MQVSLASGLRCSKARGNLQSAFVYPTMSCIMLAALLMLAKFMLVKQAICYILSLAGLHV